MEFEEILGNIHALECEFGDNVNDEFGMKVLENEIREISRIGQKLCTLEENVYGKMQEINIGLDSIKSMEPLC